jgi:peptidoglycan/xylan/chitin deacetylase (PgdA/CDA1 family)
MGGIPLRRFILLGLSGLLVQALAAASAMAQTCPGNPNALGVSRTVEIDSKGGAGVGFEHFKMHDILLMNEVVLTFDDGPWPNTTRAVLKALADHCTKAVFFAIGKHTMWHPEILHEVAQQGHTIGSHTWSHIDLSRMPLEKAKAEMEMGISAIRRTIGEAASPFIRFPALKHPPELVKYAGERDLAIFSTDVDSFDFKLRSPDKVIAGVIDRLKKRGKGIILMHDFQRVTATALPELLVQLKANGFKVVHMRFAKPVQSLPQYDEMVAAQMKGPASAIASDRPTSSIVRTVPNK